MGWAAEGRAAADLWPQVVEVKGPEDKLSTKQRLWLDRFVRLGLRAVVCQVAGECPHTSTYHPSIYLFIPLHPFFSAKRTL